MITATNVSKDVDSGVSGDSLDSGKYTSDVHQAYWIFTRGNFDDQIAD